MSTSDAMLTIVGSLAVISAVVSAFEAQRTRALAQQIRSEQQQPYVFVDIRGDPDQPTLVVLYSRNVGPTVATDIVAAFTPPIIRDPELKTSDGKRRPPISEIRIASLPPGAHMVRVLGFGGRFFPENGDTVTVTIAAQGPNGPVGDLTYEIDLAALRMTLAAETLNQRAVRALEDMAAGRWRVSPKDDTARWDE